MLLRDVLPFLLRDFPQLSEANARLTSPRDPGYNCIAWAAGDTSRWWWPQSQAYRPAEAPREETVQAFMAAYAILGYIRESGPELESGIRKIAIYASTNGQPTHAARQLPDGWWTSKLGRNVDIAHELYALEGPAYGKVKVILASGVVG